MTEVITKKRHFALLQEEWDRLAKRFSHPLVCHDWFFACAEAFYRDGDLRVIALRKRNELVGAAPLAVRKTRGRKRLELLGAPFLNEPGGVLYKDKQAFEELMHGVLSLRMPVVLQRLAWLPETGSIRRRFSAYKTLVIKRPAAASFSVPLSGSWEQFWNSLKSRRRNDFRRARKKAEQNGRVEVAMHSPAPEELQDLLSVAFSVEAAGWKGRAGSAIISKQGLKHFFETFARLASCKKNLRLCFLHINGHVAAMQIALQCFNRFWVLKIGYDERWKQFSPGMQLTHETIRCAIDHGLEAYEFLGSEEKWLNAWPVESHACQSLGFYPFSLKSLRELGIDGANFLKKRLRRSERSGN